MSDEEMIEKWYGVHNIYDATTYNAFFVDNNINLSCSQVEFSKETIKDNLLNGGYFILKWSGGALKIDNTIMLWRWWS